MKKKAIVLLVTIGFIAIITAIILQTVAISKSSLDDLMSLKRQNQMMLLINDAKKILENKDLVDYLTENETKIPIQDQKSGLSLTFSCVSLKTRFDLDKLLNCPKTECKNIIIDYANKHDLGSDTFFYELLKKHKINSLNDLKKIKELYLADTRDFYIENITKDDFEKYFFVSDLNISYAKDYKYAPSKDICKLFDLSDDDQGCKSRFQTIIKNFIPPKGKKTSTKQTNIKNLIKCKINLYNGSQENGAVFKYDTNKKEIVSIDEFF